MVLFFDREVYDYNTTHHVTKIAPFGEISLSWSELPSPMSGSVLAVRFCCVHANIVCHP